MLALLLVCAVVIYWPARRCGLISDAWELLRIADLGLPDALLAQLGYHVIPVTHLVSTVLWNTFRLWEPGYQLANLAELVLVAWGIYFLGVRLFERRLPALLAALLLLANASFYELTMWPVIGNFQFVAALLQLCGLWVAHRALRAERPLRWIALFALAAVLAFFTYEPAISLRAAGVLYAALVPRDRAEGWSPREMWSRARGLLAGGVVALVPMLAAKLFAVHSGNTALFLPRSLPEIEQRLHFAVRAVVSIFTLRGSGEAVDVVLFPLLVIPGPWSISHDAHLVLWLVALAAATLLVLVRGRQPAVSFLLLWFWSCVIVVSIATTMVSRQYLLAAMPASILLAYAIVRVADAIARRWMVESPAAAGALAFLAFGLLAGGAKSDIVRAAALHREATEAARSIRDLVAPRASQVEEVAILNLPAWLHRHGIGAAAFVNGTWPMMRLALGGALPDKRLNLYTTASSTPPGVWASGTRPIAVTDLGEKIVDPARLVLWFDPARNRIVELNAATWRFPERYSATGMPQMTWSGGPVPALAVRAGETLELPLARPSASRWGFIRFAHAEVNGGFDVLEEGEVRLRFRPDRVRAPGWITQAFPLSAGEGVTHISIRALGDLQVSELGSLPPPASYAPEAAPDFNWWMQAEPVVVVSTPTSFPVSTSKCGAGPCELVVEYLGGADGDAVIRVDDGRQSGILASQERKVEWRTVRFSVVSGEASAPRVVTIEPRGPKPVLVRRLEAAAAQNGSS